jgi:TATA-binding protein-associated factor
MLKEQHSSLADIEHGAKLPALKQLLLDCGIGHPQQQIARNSSGLNSDNQQQSQLVSQHRALIFCQLKAMLDIVENDLLRIHLPNVTYLRLDGSVPAAQRHSVVARFNADPSIDVLLLTSQVGGLGLNLTGADTVIFIEHDWNPMKDLQAMDRAHRIGQKKVVNVYRLITRQTLEEKIMGLQKFKLLTANTIISTDNASLETMKTEQVTYFIFIINIYAYLLINVDCIIHLHKKVFIFNHFYYKYNYKVFFNKLIKKCRVYEYIIKDNKR